jgi:hypothetical protein
MKNTKYLLSLLVAITCLGLGFGCASENAEDDSESSTTPTPTLVNSNLTGTWETNCVTSAQVTGAAGYYISLTLFGSNSFNYARIWYSDASCTPGNAVMSEFNGGTYSVGSLISGSLFGLSFTNSSGSEIRPETAGFATDLNNTLCTPGPVFANNVVATVNGIACEFSDQPDNTQVIDNVITKTSSTVFKMGALSTTTSGPGVYSGVTLPSSATLTFYKQ